jgi:kinesin family member 1
MLLVDLAGSERTTFGEGTNTRMLKETIQINKSLMTLRKVIQNLATKEVKNRASQHIPYRESKITALLKSSLTGNSQCMMIACLSPTDANFEENMSTLRYASITKLIKNYSHTDYKPLMNDQILL